MNRINAYFGQYYYNIIYNNNNKILLQYYLQNKTQNVL